MRQLLCRTCTEYQPIKYYVKIGKKIITSLESKIIIHHEQPVRLNKKISGRRLHLMDMMYEHIKPNYEATISFEIGRS